MARRAIYVEAADAQIRIDEIRDDIRQWLAAAVARDVRRFAPRDTGVMARSVVVSPDGSRVDVLGAGIPLNEEAPLYVEYGTRPHAIPNAFGYGITVQHPGTQAQPFMRPAAYRKRHVPPWVARQRHNMADQ